jgi:hypothetical protein
MKLFASESEKRNRTAGAHIEAGIFGWTTAIAAILIVSSITFALSAPGDWRSRLGVGITAAGLFLAAAAIGAMLGFVFGLPRSRSAPSEDGEATTSSAGSHFLANSNLLKVSDWLTTILIGLGLVQLGRVAPALTQLADAVEAPLGGTSNAGAFAVSVMVAVAVAGALMAYLWTSIRVRELFEQVEEDFDDLQRAVAISLQADVAKYAALHADVELDSSPDDATLAALAELERDIAVLVHHAASHSADAAKQELHSLYTSLDGRPGDVQHQQLRHLLAEIC